MQVRVVRAKAVGRIRWGQKIDHLCYLLPTIMPYHRVIAFVLLAVLSWPLPRIARGAEMPPDIVRLRSGGMFRGTILEYDPDKEIRILLPGGSEKVIPSNLVEYAGPANGKPPLAQSATSEAQPLPTEGEANKEGSNAEPVPLATQPRAKQMRDYETSGTASQFGSGVGGKVYLTSPKPGITFHLKTGNSNATVAGTSYQWMGSSPPTSYSGAATAEHFQRLCTAPCATSLEPGTYRLGLSVDDGDVAAANAVHLEGGSEVEGVYQSNTGLRATGIVLFLASLGVMLASIDNGSNALMWTCVIGASVGGGMMFMPDSASVRVK